VLKVENLHKQFGGRQVVKGVSFAIHRGEIVGLLGPKGAGKTTSFYMTVGLIPLDDGHIFLNQEEISDAPMFRRARRGISYLPQEPSIFRRLTVEENLLAVAETLDTPRGERLERCERLLEELSIAHVRTSPGYALSGGERRRAEIARALVLDPAFILLDEPFAGVDPIAVADIQEIILNLRAQGIGVLITDHSVRDTLSIVDTAFIMNEGEILLSGPSCDIAKSDLARAVYLGENFILDCDD
jgi:lipopolysaccharide export system ATP-binding protein